jgi:hypothetical protein
MYERIVLHCSAKQKAATIAAEHVREDELSDADRDPTTRMAIPDDQILLLVRLWLQARRIEAARSRSAVHM